MSRGICVVSSGSRLPWLLELFASQKCPLENFAMIGANGKQASVSEHGVGRLRRFHYAGGQQSLRLWRLRRPQEPEQSEKSQRLRIPRPTSANATAVPITRSVHPPPRNCSPPPPAEAWIDCRLLRLLGPTQTATPRERNVQTACKKPLRIRNLRFMGNATPPNLRLDQQICLRRFTPYNRRATRPFINS